MVSQTGTLKTTSLIPGLGVKVELDLTQAISEDIRSQLRTLFDHYYLLFIEAPNLSAEKHLDLFETFGRAIPATTDGKVQMIVSNVLEGGYLGSYELEWHIDGSFMAEPFLVNCLYALDVVDRSSATRFVSAAAAFERLPEDLKHELRKRVATFGTDLVAAAHRLVSHHPRTGAPYLAANAYQTDSVIGLDPDESRKLLQQVYEYMYSPEHVYEHWWRNGDLIIWDNRVVQHSRGNVAAVGARTLRRFTSGPATVLEQLPARQRAVMTAAFRARLGPDAQKAYPANAKEQGIQVT
jgi:taurine dioxygenase